MTSSMKRIGKYVRWTYSDGTKGWLLNGKLHREDGPAVEYVTGIKEWWLNGQQITEDEHANQMFIKWCTTPVEYTGDDSLHV